jgi:hypothetical protein
MDQKAHLFHPFSTLSQKPLSVLLILPVVGVKHHVLSIRLGGILEAMSTKAIANLWTFPGLQDMEANNLGQTCSSIISFLPIETLFLINIQSLYC